MKGLLTGVGHHEFLPEVHTINKEYYNEVMHGLREAIHQERPEPMQTKRLASIEKIKEKSKQDLWAIAKGAFQKCFED